MVPKRTASHTSSPGRLCPARPVPCAAVDEAGGSTTGTGGTGRVADLAGAEYRRRRSGAHRLTVRTVTTFDVPGLDDALAIPGIPREYRSLLESLRAGMTSTTEGEQDDAGNRRRTVVLEATPDRRAMSCVLVDHGRKGFYSRDGLRFGVIGSTAPPAETEQALAMIDDLEVEEVSVDEGPTGRRLTATLAEKDITRIVDARRVLGSDMDSTTTAGRIEIESDANQVVLRLIADFTAAHQMAGAIAVRSETVATYTERSDTDGIEAPRLSMSMPEIGGIREAFRLSTPRGARATKGAKGRPRRRR